MFSLSVPGPQYPNSVFLLQRTPFLVLPYFSLWTSLFSLFLSILVKNRCGAPLANPRLPPAVALFPYLSFFCLFPVFFNYPSPVVQRAPSAVHPPFGLILLFLISGFVDVVSLNKLLLSAVREPMHRLFSDEQPNGSFAPSLPSFRAR